MSAPVSVTLDSKSFVDEDLKIIQDPEFRRNMSTVDLELAVRSSFIVLISISVIHCLGSTIEPRKISIRRRKDFLPASLTSNRTYFALVRNRAPTFLIN